MANSTKIEWCDATWNPITGCSLVSPGCRDCYAMRDAGGRLKNHPSRKGLTRRGAHGPVWNGSVRFNRDWIDQPFRWKRPRRIFTCAHGDLFHPSVPGEWIDEVLDMMTACPWHQFLVLTKRPRRMQDTFRHRPPGVSGWLPNLWLGVSVETADFYDRIYDLQDTPAAVRFLSLEPLLGPMTALPLSGIDWVIAGGESGSRARPMNPDWVRHIRDRCAADGTAFFFKQWGEWGPREGEGRDRYEFSRFAGGERVWRVGKRLAGRLLDGRTHDDCPDQ